LLDKSNNFILLILHQLNHMTMPSSTKENYIKTLYYLHLENDNISLSELGKELEVSKPTANDMVKKLAIEGLVKNENYKPIRITEKGKKEAAKIIRKHRLSETFLFKIMNFGWEEVHVIAEELEHITTDAFFDRMDELLGFPTEDPHGSAIPDKNGNFSQRQYKALSTMPVGTKVIVKALKNSSAELLLYLNKKGIQINTEIEIMQIEDFDGAYTICYDAHSEAVLSRSVCQHLLVNKI